LASTDTTDLLAAELAALDEAVLIGIIDSTTAQCEDLAGRPGAEARTMLIVLGLVATAAESALLRQRTGVTV
jgi:hypothetical protein